MIIIVPSFETQNPWGISSAGRAPALHAGGQEFESPILQNLKIRAERLFFSAFYLCIVVLFQGLLKLRILRAKPIKCPIIRVLTVHFSQYFSLSKCTQKPIK